jgi:NADPH:quinone reductase-like Zn-dependent oxidoreductase
VAPGRGAPGARPLGPGTTRFEEAAADVDVVIDLVGDARDRTSTRSPEVLRPGGLLVATGTADGGQGTVTVFIFKQQGMVLKVVSI